jgi:hypothetical protein
VTSRASSPIRVVRAVSRIMPTVALLSLGGCASTTLFQSSFNAQPLDVPPRTTQRVGTMQLISNDTAIKVEMNPLYGPSDNWLRLSRFVFENNINGTPPTMVQATLAQTFPDGNYSFVGVFFVAANGPVTVEFDASPQGPNALSFLHLDFMPDGTVRFDDDPLVTCCHYERDFPFTLSVSIQVTANSAVAHVSVLGGREIAGNIDRQGVSQGSYDYTIKQPSFATRFGAFRLSIGYPWAGRFFATDLLVTRHN